MDADYEGSLVPVIRYLGTRAEVMVEEAVLLKVPRICREGRDRARISGTTVRLAAREQLLAEADLVITYGGDGSLIAAAAAIQRPDTGLVGINAGHLGFLTEGNLDEALAIVREIFEGRPRLDPRLRLSARVHRGGRLVHERDAMNDLVVRQGRTNALLELDARIDGVELIRFRADGVIAATPSGSTAYALSAGGPIVHPSLECIQLTPIAAFTLSARPILLPSRAVITLELCSTRHDATISFDGQRNFDLLTGDRIEIRESQVKVRFIRTRADDYYRTLREKLGWQRHAG